MGKINQPSNLLDRIKHAEQQVQRLWKAVGLSSATIARGGLTLLQDAFLRMVDDNDTETLYVGPDNTGKQIVRLRRESGARVLSTYFTNATTPTQYWALYDNADRIIVSDDALSGVGMARPWLPVPMYQHFVPRTLAETTNVGEAFSYSTIDASKITSETKLWRGHATISHPWIAVDGVWGPASGTPSVTYKLNVGGVTVGQWSPGFEAVVKGPFDVSAQIGKDWVAVELTAIASGTGIVACQVRGCYLRQT